MRKTQFALAALALVASTAAMAEVGIYGTLDAGIANSSVKGTQFSGDGGWVAGNNIGFRGSEDLGDGLKANFNLRAGINLGSGGSDNGGNGTLFNQLANVGVSGEFGSIALGQQFSPFIGAVAGGTAGVGHFFVNRIIMGSAAAGSVTGGGQSAGGFFIANAVSYTSPTLNGFSLSALTNAKNGGPNVAGTANVDDRYDTAVVNADVGGVKVAAGYESRSTYKNYLLAGSYAMKELTLSGTYMMFEPASTADKRKNSYSVSAAYQLTPAISANVQYAAGKNATDKDTSLTGLGVSYSLSKTTAAYVSYTRGTGGAVSNYSYRGTTTLGASNNTTAVGITHSF